MGSMKNTNNRLRKWNLTRAQMASDMEIIARHSRTEYHNTTVSAYNAEMYAMRNQIEYLMDIVAEQGKAIAELMKENNELRSQVMRVIRNSGTVQRTITVTEEITMPQVEMEEPDYIENPPYYTPGGRINWHYAEKDPEWPPVRIAFNEFDRYRYKNNIYTMIGQDEVRRNWSTLSLHSRKLTGMTLGRLLKQYAKERGLNY